MFTTVQEVIRYIIHDQRKLAKQYSNLQIKLLHVFAVIDLCGRW